MRVLMYSPAFYPGIGGLENFAAMVAEGLTELGCQVTVVAITSGLGDEARFPYTVVRRPGPLHLLRLVQWCDIFFHHNVSLKGIWPLLFIKRPWVVAHHGWYSRSNGAIGWRDLLKRRATRFATNIAVSMAVADHLGGVAAAVIPNPYNDALFREIPSISRDRELVFLGRLVSDKGCDLLLESLVMLRQEGLTPHLTIIGTGPEETLLRACVDRLGLERQVSFAGTLAGEELVTRLNHHQLLVTPSRWNEPFGIVALEGIACGCLIVASSGGGLPEAVGPCGLTFSNGDARALADRIADVLRRPERRAVYLAGAPAHLSRHRRAHVARAYHEVLERVLAGKRLQC